MSFLSIREMQPSDDEAWLALRHKLWPDSSIEELRQEQSKILTCPLKHGIYAAFDGDTMVGFIECSLREWADGCFSHPVGYIEGWYVEASHRRNGAGRRLIETAESWARSHGCTEMASDARPNNHVSLCAHAALGYTEVGRAVHFRKPLG